MSLFRAFSTGEDRPPIDDQNLVDRLYKRHRMRIMFAITIGYGLVYTCRLALSMVKKPLIDGGIFTPVELGIIGSALFYTYAFGKLTNGFLADHMNLKIFFAFGVLISALINIGMGFSTILWVSVLLWGLNGWFQGFGAPTGAVALATWFSNSERGRMYGIWSTAHAIGEGLTFVGVAGLVTLWGWRAGFWGPGLMCIVVAGGLYWLMQDRPQTLGLPRVAEWKNDFVSSDEGSKDKKESTWAVQRTILKIPAIWVLALASASIYVTRYAINSWGVLYLQEAKGYTLMQAGGVISVNTIAGASHQRDLRGHGNHRSSDGLLRPARETALHDRSVLYLWFRSDRARDLARWPLRPRHRPQTGGRGGDGIHRRVFVYRRRDAGPDQRPPDRARHHHDRRRPALRLYDRDLVLDRFIGAFVHPRHLPVAGPHEGLREL